MEMYFYAPRGMSDQKLEDLSESHKKEQLMF
jgi:hypothetical protein